MTLARDTFGPISVLRIYGHVNLDPCVRSRYREAFLSRYSAGLHPYKFSYSAAVTENPSAHSALVAPQLVASQRVDGLVPHTASHVTRSTPLATLTPSHVRDQSRDPLQRNAARTLAKKHWKASDHLKVKLQVPEPREQRDSHTGRSATNFAKGDIPTYQDSLTLAVTASTRSRPCAMRFRDSRVNHDSQTAVDTAHRFNKMEPSPAVLG